MHLYPMATSTHIKDETVTRNYTKNECEQKNYIKFIVYFLFTHAKKGMKQSLL